MVADVPAPPEGELVPWLPVPLGGGDHVDVTALETSAEFIVCCCGVGHDLVAPSVSGLRSDLFLRSNQVGCPFRDGQDRRMGMRVSLDLSRS
jgi:hypothetical protein